MISTAWSKFSRYPKVSISSWITRFIEIVSVAVSLKYISPATIGLVYLAIAIRDMALRTASLTGVEQLAHRDGVQADNEFKEIVRINCGLIIALLLPLYALAVFWTLSLSAIHIFALSIYFACGYANYNMSLLWNLYDKKVWYVNLVSIAPGSMLYAAVIYFASEKGWNELDVLILAMVARSLMITAMILAFSSHCSPKIGSFQPFEFKRLWYLVFGVAGSVAKNVPAYISSIGSLIDDASLGIFSRGIGLCEAFFQPLSKLNSILIGQWINNNTRGERANLLVVCIASIIIIVLAAVCYPLIFWLLNVLLDLLEADHWVGLMYHFPFLYLLCCSWATRRFWERYAWQDTDAVRLLSLMSIIGLASTFFALYLLSVHGDSNLELNDLVLAMIGYSLYMIVISILTRKWRLS